MGSDRQYFLLFLLLSVVISAPVLAKKQKTNGAALFAESCAKCHVGGGNIVNHNKPVIGSKHLSTLATFKAYLSSPPGHMPYYQELVENKENLQALYDYCKRLKTKPVKQAKLDSKDTHSCT